MSVISKRYKNNRDRTRSASTQSPVIGKVSIGVPAAEPVLVERSEGLKVRRQIKFEDGTGIRRGTKVKPHHIEKMKAMGMEEVPVVYGKSPDTLSHFRVLRKSNKSDGYVEDPAIYDKYDLDPGESLTEIPIMLTSEDIDTVLQTRLVNYDRSNNCVFCSSNDGETAMRRKKDENGDYLPTGEKFELECVPFYFDERVENGEKEICPYRKAGGGGRDCSFTGSLYFQILNEAGNFELGRYFKIETTSSRVAEYYIDALLDPDKGVINKIGRISFVPLKLEIVKEKTVRPGSRYGEQKKASVYRTTISVDDEYLDKYKPAVEKIMQTIEGYREMNTRLGIGSAQDDPLAIPEENAPADEPDRWQSEFDPQNYEKQLEKEGLLDVAEEAESEIDRSSVVVQKGESASTDNGTSARNASENDAFQAQLQEMQNRARRLPSERYQKFLSNVETVPPANIDDYSQALDGILDALDEEEKEKNFEDNVAYEKGLDDEEATPMDLPFAANA